MQEIWKDIVGYEGLYQVSNLGNVKSLDRIQSDGRKRKSRILKQWQRGTNKHKVIDLWKNSNRFVISVHKLVYITFKDDYDEKLMIHHIDHNMYNNCIDNLAQLTVQKHNKIHCTGRTPWNKGIEYGKTKAFKKGLKVKKIKHLNRCKQMLIDFEKSNLSVTKFCKTINITTGTFYERKKFILTNS